MRFFFFALCVQYFYAYYTTKLSEMRDLTFRSFTNCYSDASFTTCVEIDECFNLDKLEFVLSSEYRGKIVWDQTIEAHRLNFYNDSTCSSSFKVRTQEIDYANCASMDAFRGIRDAEATDEDYFDLENSNQEKVRIYFFCSDEDPITLYSNVLFTTHSPFFWCIFSFSIFLLKVFIFVVVLNVLYYGNSCFYGVRIKSLDTVRIEKLGEKIITLRMKIQVSKEVKHENTPSPLQVPSKNLPDEEFIQMVPHQPQFRNNFAFSEPILQRTALGQHIPNFTDTSLLPVQHFEDPFGSQLEKMVHQMKELQSTYYERKSRTRNMLRREVNELGELGERDVVLCREESSDDLFQDTESEEEEEEEEREEVEEGGESVKKIGINEPPQEPMGEEEGENSSSSSSYETSSSNSNSTESDSLQQSSSEEHLQHDQRRFEFLRLLYELPEPPRPKRCPVFMDFLDCFCGSLTSAIFFSVIKLKDSIFIFFAVVVVSSIPVSPGNDWYISIRGMNYVVQVYLLLFVCFVIICDSVMTCWWLFSPRCTLRIRYPFQTLLVLSAYHRDIWHKMIYYSILSFGITFGTACVIWGFKVTETVSISISENFVGALSTMLYLSLPFVALVFKICRVCKFDGVGSIGIYRKLSLIDKNMIHKFPRITIKATEVFFGNVMEGKLHDILFVINLLAPDRNGTKKKKNSRMLLEEEIQDIIELSISQKGKTALDYLTEVKNMRVENSSGEYQIEYRDLPIKRISRMTTKQRAFLKSFFFDEDFCRFGDEFSDSPMSRKWWGFVCCGGLMETRRIVKKKSLVETELEKKVKELESELEENNNDTSN